MTDQQPYTAPEMPYNSIPPPPLAQVGTPFTPTNRRPTAALVIGIILLVFALFSIYKITTQIHQITGHSTSQIMIPRTVNIFFLYGNILGFGLDLLMGIGLLMMSRWARKVTIISLIVLFILSFVKAALTVSTMSISTGYSGQIGSDIFRIIIIVIVVVGVLFSLVVGGLFIYFLSRPNVVKAFRDAGER